MNREQLERELAACLAVVRAGKDEGTDAAEEEEVVASIRQRLDSGDSLIAGDPNGIYTYEDPVLALAAEYARLSEEGILATAGNGDELRNSRLDLWLRVAFRAVKRHLDRADAVLMSRVPRLPIEMECETLRLAIVGDAGYAGHAQSNVLRMIRARQANSKFDRLIHLGDTYFGGSIGEITKNLLAPLRSLPIEALTLCGNHDLYYGPEGFEAAMAILRQPGRYFSIETPCWVIACLDTALGSARLMRNDGALDPTQLEWLTSLLIEKKDARPVLLLSHHFIVSDWEDPAETLRLQLKDLVRDRIFAWYWGHEHRTATYEAKDHGFFGACVGHGAFLESLSASRRSTASWLATGRCNCYRSDGPDFHPHGYLELELRKNELIEIHHLEDGSRHTRCLKLS